MSDLDDFLKHDIEGYLFHDLRAMQSVTAPQGAPGGGLGYPQLFTALAGIELLGALLSKTTFNTYSGQAYFRDYWHRFLYPGRSALAEVDVVYQLARHGVAHTFLLKGKLGVLKGQPAHHLTHATNGMFLIDATTLAEDLMSSYEKRVKPYLDSPTPDVSRTDMEARLADIASIYSAQAAPLLQAARGVRGAAASGPLPPGAGPSGPIGPVSSDVSSSFGPQSPGPKS
jgi:hypothetical protein